VLLQESPCFQLLLLRHDISQGSVATHLRCGGIFSDSISNFENQLIFDEVKAYKKTVPFLGHSVDANKSAKLVK